MAPAERWRRVLVVDPAALPFKGRLRVSSRQHVELESNSTCCQQLDNAEELWVAKGCGEDKFLRDGRGSRRTGRETVAFCACYVC